MQYLHNISSDELAEHYRGPQIDVAVVPKHSIFGRYGSLQLATPAFVEVKKPLQELT